MAEHLDRTVEYLLAQSWQIAVLVVMVALLSWVLRNRSAHIRYLLWLVVLAKCLVPPALEVPVAVLPAPKPQVVSEALLMAPRETTVPATTTAINEGLVSEVRSSGPSTSPALSLRQWLAVIWMAGATIFAFVALTKAARTAGWLRRQRQTLPVDLRTGIEALLPPLGVKRSPRIWLIEGIGQPFVWGLARGQIYLPTHFARLEDRQHQRDILGHELSHVLRFDASVNTLQIVAQAVFWFHPFVWWANRKIRQEREKCCDEMAIARFGAGVKSYSKAIINTVARAHESTRPVPSLAVAGSLKHIEERIRTMMTPGKHFYKHPGLAATTFVFLLGLLTVPTVLVLTAQAETEAAPTPLHKAAALGTVNETRRLILNGIDIDSKDKFGQTPLHLATRYGNESVAELLISQGADIHAQDRYGNMPLHYAAEYEQTDMAELLINKGASVNARNKRGHTALHFSAEYGWTNLDIAQLLIANGADINAEDHWRGTPLDMASWNSMQPLVELLIANDAKRYSYKQMDSWKPLFTAARHGDKDRLRLLISQGLDVNVKDDSGWTPLHHASQQGHVDACALLIAKGADVNAKDAQDWRPLHRAAAGGHIDVARLLLDHGARVDAWNKWSETPLRSAIPNNQKGVVELLIARGADVNARFNDGYTPLFYATDRTSRKEIAEILISKGADVNARAFGGQVALYRAAREGNRDVVRTLIEKGSDVNTRDREGQTPLHLAAMKCRNDLVRLLVEGGADVNIKDSSGMTALHYATDAGRKDMAELLISKDAEPNVENILGVRPLHMAAALGHKGLAELLITHGAEVNAKNGRSETALSLAKDKGQGAMVELLREHGAKE